MLGACASSASVKFPFLVDGLLDVTPHKLALCFDSPCPFLTGDLSFYLDQPCAENASDESGAQPNPCPTSVALHLGPCAGEPIQHPSSHQGAVLRLLDIPHE
eukprot:5782685-Pyramimonas_sp.AAC.1